MANMVLLATFRLRPHIEYRTLSSFCLPHMAGENVLRSAPSRKVSLSFLVDSAQFFPFLFGYSRILAHLFKIGQFIELSPIDLTMLEQFLVTHPATSLFLNFSTSSFAFQVDAVSFSGRQSIQISKG